MQIHTTIKSLRAALADAGRIAFAPTMGNLHDGHISLIENARKYGDTTVSSIFINRLQFGPNEDFDRYPRTFAADCAKLEAAGTHHLFAPEETELYPHPQTYCVAAPPQHAGTLEGAVRPGHFDGVATVVTKLFNIVQPQIALFGKKDFQQLMIIRNLVVQMNMPIEIVACETVRAADGLALSSRNTYLSDAERAIAPQLQEVLQSVVASILEGRRDFELLEQQAIKDLNANGWATDYVAVRRRQDLQAPTADDALVVLGAARLGSTRLIDNIEIA